MKDNEEKSLTEMLLHLNIPELPPELENSDRIWAIAIVKLLRRNGKTDYAVAEHDMFAWKELHVKKESIGVISPVDVLGIYPICYVNDDDIPPLTQKDDIIKYVSLNTNASSEKLSLLSNEKLKSLFMDIVIKSKINRWYKREQAEEERNKEVDVVRSYTESAHKIVGAMPKIDKEENIPVKIDTIILPTMDNIEEEDCPIELRNPDEIKRRGRKPKR